jgi:putative ATP-binding cassette transporter
MRDIIRIFSFLLRLTGGIRFTRAAIVLIALTGVAGGVATTGMIALINNIINQKQSPPASLIWLFVGLCVALPAFRFAAQVLLIDLSQSSLLELRLRLSRRVLAAPLRQLEAIGASRLLATLTNDIGAVVDTMAMVPVLIMHSALVASCLVYLAWLNWRLLLQVLAFATFGVLTYRAAVARAMDFFRRSRRRLDEVIGQIRAMVEGTKELKMHRARRDAFVGAVAASTKELQRENRAGQMVFAATSSWGQVLFFVLVGTIVLVMPRFQSLDTKTLTGYTIVFFQMMAPIEVLLTAFPALSRATIAASTVEELGFSLEREAEEESAGAAPPPGGGWQRIELVGVTHSYRVAEHEGFTLGPIDLTFREGELVFLVGGNGSGKTTLAKLMLGLYVPEEGELRVGGELVTAHNREAYRERFSAVFSDFFVFEKLLGLDTGALDQEALRYLKMLQLDHKLRVEQGVLSTLDLSQGQRKRLALLTAYLEDRPLYLFDEWAADQDPSFKEVFYHELLPALKRRGKTVFVISHDDHYFHVADRIVKLDYGKIESDTAVPEAYAALPLAGVEGEIRA